MDGITPEIPPGSVNPEGKNRRVTTGQWEHLLHTAIVGTAIFPQSYFVQGIRLAHDMTELSRTSSLPLSTFFEEDAPPELIRTMLDPSRVKAHAAYGFKTRSYVDDAGLAYSWGRDKSHARSVLYRFAGAVLGKEQSALDFNLDINNLVTDPGFQGLLKEAFDALNKKEVRDISNDYKKLISDFMQEHASKEIQISSPEHDAYKIAQSQLMKELVLKAGGASSLIGKAVSEGPTATSLPDQRGSTLAYMFGWPEVTPVDPLELLDY